MFNAKAEAARQVIEHIERAEQMAPAGSYDQGKYVQAALYAEWPSIKALLKDIVSR